MTRLFALLLVLPLHLMAQTWVKVANEDDKVAASMPVRYGSGTAWTAPKVISGTFAVSNATFGDPAPNTVKELDIQQTSAVQTVTVNGTAVVVPAAMPVASASVTVPSQAIALPGVVLPQLTCPIVGKNAVCPQRTLLAPGQTATKQQTLPVTVSGAGFSLTCPTIPTASQPSVSGCTLTVPQ